MTKPPPGWVEKGLRRRGMALPVELRPGSFLAVQLVALRKQMVEVAERAYQRHLAGLTIDHERAELDRMAKVESALMAAMEQAKDPTP